jgi:hypothetical protein
MKSNLTTSVGAYGFGHDWTLSVTTKKGTKNFYLGQDGKFCTRVLGMSARDVVAEIGSNDLGNEKVLKKLAKFIVKHLGLTEKKVDELETWELCCQ